MSNPQEYMKLYGKTQDLRDENRRLRKRLEAAAQMALAIATLVPSDHEAHAAAAKFWKEVEAGK